MISPPWALTGNTGTNPTTNFIGTSDNQPLTVKTNGARRALIDTSGNIELTGNLGIGTGAPRSLVEAEASAPGALGPVLTLTNTGGNPNAAAALDLNTFAPASTGTYNPSSRIEAVDTGNYANDIVFLSNRPGAANNGLVERMRITADGLTLPGSSAGPGDLTFPSKITAPVGLTIAGNVTVSAAASGALGPSLTLTNTAGNPNAAASIDLNTYSPSVAAVYTGVYNPSSRIEALDDGNYSNDIVFLTNKPGAANSGLVERVRITANGLTLPGDIVLTGADCAEHFDVTGPVLPEPGTVLVIDKEGSLRESCEAYDKKVAGVVSGAGEYRHGILLDGRPSDEPRVALALTGKVYCKVDAQYSPIEVGDLLTTSPTPGHAMKATEAAKAFGSVIGKALRALEGGQGLVLILVSLQ
jgi:hypothetical protein